MSRASLLLIALAGCYHPTVIEGAPCTTETDCPSSQICDVGTCRFTAVRDGAVDVPDDTRRIDAPDTDAPDIDAPGPAVCATPTNLGAFGAPTHLLGLSSPFDDGTPWVTADLREMFYKSERVLGGQGGGDIWRTVRAVVTDPWGNGINVTELNTTANEGSPELSADRLTIYFSSNRAGGLGGFDIWMATRLTVQSTWSAPVHVPALSSASYDEGFTMLPSGLVGYLHSTRAANGSSIRLFRTTRPTTTATWGTPVLVTEFANADYENPALTADECTIYFQSDRTGSVGLADLWVTTRTTPTGTWGTPVNLSSINSPQFDGDPWLSADQRTIFFGSAVTTGSFDLHTATR